MIKLLLHVLRKFTHGDWFLSFYLCNHTLILQKFLKPWFLGLKIEALEKFLIYFCVLLVSRSLQYLE